MLTFNALVKGGPYIGPRGGKWADPQHTVAWKEEGATPKAKQVDPKNPYLFDLDSFRVVDTEYADLRASGKWQAKVDGYKGDASRPITVTKIGGDYHILDGHHRTGAARKKGLPVRAFVIPHAAVEKMKAEGIHQGEMFRAFAGKIRSGEYPGLDKSLDTKATFNALVKGAYRGKGKRTGSPGNYQYTYDEPKGQQTVRDSLVQAGKQACGYMNCKLFVQTVTSVSKLDDLPSRPFVSADDLVPGDVLKWGQGTHWAISVGGGDIMEVEEWGAESRIVPLSEVSEELDPPDMVFSTAKLRLVDGKSPLDYHGRRPRRLSLEGGEPADGKQSNFPKGSKTAGFADYSVSMRGSDKVVSVHYINVSKDHLGKGLGKKLINAVYEKFKDAAEIDWGNVYSDAMEHMLEQRRDSQKAGEPRTYFKPW